MNLRRLALLPSLAWVSAAAPAASVDTSGIVARSNGAACRLSSVASVDLSLGFTNNKPSFCSPSVGTLNAFMFFVDFSDAVATETPKTLLDIFSPSAPNWYNTSSFGKLNLNLTSDTSKFFRMPSTTSSYGFQRSLSYTNQIKYIQDALDAYLKGGNTIPKADVIYIMPTKVATQISFSPTFMGPVKTRAGATVAKSAITFGDDVHKAWKFKVMNHETGHSMCLPDLYAENDNGKYVGGFDLMGYILGAAPDYFAWEKWFLGWLEDDQIDCITAAGSSIHTVTPIEVSPTSATDVKAVVVRKNATTAVVAEVRAKLGNDASACGAGVLLYTVSTTTNSYYGPIRIFDTKPQSGGCGGDEKNDAPLTASSYTVAGLGVKVTINSQAGGAYNFTVDVS